MPSMQEDRHWKLAILLILLTAAILVTGAVTGSVSAASTTQDAATEEPIPVTQDVMDQPVATVDGQIFIVAQFRKRATFERALLTLQLNNAITVFKGFGFTGDQIKELITSQAPYSTWYDDLQYADMLGLKVVDSLVEDEIVRQKAQELGVSVSNADLDTKMKEQFGYDPATPNALESMNQAQDDFFAAMRTNAGASDAEIYDYFRMLALRDKLRDAVMRDFPHTAPFVNVRHIVVANEATAKQILEALQSGKSFANLAQAYSTDTTSGASGGELGWANANVYVKEFADAVKTADIGALVGPVQTQFGYHIIQVIAREERELNDEDYKAARDTAFSQYLTDLRETMAANVQVFDTWINNVPTEPVFVLGTEAS